MESDSLPLHEYVIAEERTAQEYPAARDTRSRSRTASRHDILASGDDRVRIHDWDRTFSGQRTFREAGRPRGDREFSFRRHCYRYGDVGARGDGRGTSGRRFFWTVRGDVCAPVGRFCDPLHVLAMPGIRYWQRGGRGCHLLQVLVASCAVLDVDRFFFARAAVRQYHQHQKFWRLRILVRDDQGRYHFRVSDIGDGTLIWRGISAYWLRELHRARRILSEWLEWHRTGRNHGDLQFSGIGDCRRDCRRSGQPFDCRAACIAADTLISGALLSRWARHCGRHCSLEGTGTRREPLCPSFQIGGNSWCGQRDE